MKPAEYYRGKEQTYVKHFFLEKYLETVAFHIGHSQREFVYVDCFSGPWRNGDEDLADTSIRISLDRLNYVRDVLAEKQKYPTINAIFIERDPTSFVALQQSVKLYQGRVQTTALNGEFENSIPQILSAINGKFAFIFIDPTGWNVQMQRIKPLLLHSRGEVVINLMYDFINRFINAEDASTEASLDRFFGCKEWRELRASRDREAAIVEFYKDRIRNIGSFPYVTSTKILKPLHDRAYFHLIYATRSPKGIEKCREVERRLVSEQDRVRGSAQRENRIEKSGQSELFFEQPQDLSSPVQDERAAQRVKAKDLIYARLRRGPCHYEKLLPDVLQIPLFWKTDLNEVLMEEQLIGRITIHGMTTKQRKPKEGCLLSLATQEKVR